MFLVHNLTQARGWTVQGGSPSHLQSPVSCDALLGEGTGRVPLNRLRMHCLTQVGLLTDQLQSSLRCQILILQSAVAEVFLLHTTPAGTQCGNGCKRS